ncbi:MAG: nucleotidyltransferase family protein [Ruminococcus sp.]|nr:nucleotidyltransferase family protein [Ruminococcus sp.]
MKISGIICEYNPFHNGHLHHIRETRKNGATHIVAVMSGNFVQRGDVAVIGKLERAKLAVRSGVDLVIELPVQYCLSSAENFSAGAVWLLNSLGVVEEISFGSECGDIRKLSTAFKTVQDVIVSDNKEIMNIMEKGYTYPRALSSVVNGIDPVSASVIAEPNNLLAIEYLSSMAKFSSEMKPFTVRRTGTPHDSDEPYGDITSASDIRNRIFSGDGLQSAGDFMPDIWREALENAIQRGETASLERLERVMLYKLRTSSPEEIAIINDVGQGLENRIYNARMSGSLDELFFTIKTKRYTMARIRRIMLSVLIGITRDDMKYLPPFGRILAFNERGREILALAKGKTSIPYGSSVVKLSQISEIAERFVDIEMRASDLYGLSLETVTSAQKDYRAKIMIDME